MAPHYAVFFMLPILTIGCTLPQQSDVQSPSPHTATIPAQVITIADVMETDEVFKEVDGTTLTARLFELRDRDRSTSAPAIVFFFGGGWVGGSPEQFYPHCRYFAMRGMVAVAAEYRVRSRHGVSPVECVLDGKSAVRWLRQNAERLAIDPLRIVASGGSAGGHVAACTGMIDDLGDSDDDISISSRPQAMVLFNPVLDTSEEGFGYAILQEKALSLSPLGHVDAFTPPTIIFHGTADQVVPISTIERFAEAMEAANRRCDVEIYEGYQHGFFNYQKEGDRDQNWIFYDTLSKADAFLVDLGMLSPPDDAERIQY